MFFFEKLSVSFLLLDFLVLKSVDMAYTGRVYTHDYSMFSWLTAQQIRCRLIDFMLNNIYLSDDIYITGKLSTVL